tara:strand:- start:1141 stop:1623 length:483 start_codon:yes stop_codon:yes gene_type:complete
MKNLSKQINEIIKEELSLINIKINGPVLLEILKYKLIDKLKVSNLSFNSKNVIDKDGESTSEYELSKITNKLIFFKSPVISLNTIIKDDLLIICLKEIFRVDIENIKSKKIFSYKCTPFTGLIIPDKSKCSFNYSKDAIILELRLRDNSFNVENSQESTI